MHRVLNAEVQHAYDDLCSRTLARIPSSLERLIHIASTRDYNSGVYHHEGLASAFGAEAAGQAIEYAHAETFRAVALLPLQQLTDELEKYMRASRENPLAFLKAWQRLEPYRVAIPMRVEATLAELFVSNIKLALAVLRHRLPPAQEQDRQPGALPPPSPDPQSPLPSHN